ncbi:energy transducer TonB [uncultured Porticoccus sp.]|uniref:energy transducer TonB n=1 Tax=uncultured Porticoccus sp. TaxID=1256050 RepID=UPI002628B712|nr:energy transducer TonB [uncultured Porticoccus sp.]
MPVAMPEIQPEHQSDRLGFSIFLAVAIHAMIIFGIGFKLQQQQSPAPTLEVTLAQHHHEIIDETPDFIAQQQQQGSGKEQQINMLTTDQRPELSAQQQRLSASPPEQQRQQTRRGAVALISSTSGESAPTETAQEAKEGDTAVQSPPAMTPEFASLQAKLDEKKREYSTLPNVLRVTSASTKAAEYAAYLQYWIDRIEVIGNNHYPEEARRKAIFGDLRLAVTLLPDGTVEKIEILLSSGQRVLDLAAVRTVRLASPFAPFPPEMKQWDKLEIIRTWQFEPGHRLNTQ